MSAFFEAPGAQVVAITHGGGALTLDHRKGSFFDVVATGNITNIISVNEKVPSSFIVRITASGGLITLNLNNLSPDAGVAATNTLNDGEFLTFQGLVSPSSS